MKQRKPKNPLAGIDPWAWAVGIVRGCNLKCGHCAVRMMPDSEKNGRPMDEKTWRALFELIAKVSPARRVEIGLNGEPTLHPRLVEFVSMARELSPWSQIMIITNGVELIKGSVTYRDLFEAGVNVMYVDMYHPEEQHVKLAEASGVQFYRYHDKPEGAPGAWTYTGPDLQLITLMEPPVKWPKKRKRLGRLGTWFNHLDWGAAKKFDLVPVVEAPQRGCTQVFRYCPVTVDGLYQVCCQDMMGESVGPLGGVHDGVEGWLKYWFGPTLQQHRKWLRAKNRAASPYCSRCNINFSRSDFRMWNLHQFEVWWNGEEWCPMDDQDFEVSSLLGAAEAIGDPGDVAQVRALLDSLGEEPEPEPEPTEAELAQISLL